MVENNDRYTYICIIICIYIYTYIVNANDMNYYRRLGGVHFRPEDGTQHRLGDEAATKTQALPRMWISTVKLSCPSAVKNGTPRYKQKKGLITSQSYMPCKK